MFPKWILTCMVLLGAGAVQAGMPSWQYLSPVWISGAADVTTGYDPVGSKWYVYAASGIGGTYRTENALNDWAQKPGGGGSCIVCGANEPNVVYSASGPTVWWSNTRGDNWEPRSTGISPNFSALSLGIDPTTPDFVILGGYRHPTESNVYRTTNGGVQWDALSLPSTDMDVMDLKVVPTNPRSVYLAGGKPPQLPPGSGMGFYRSLDGGSSWQKFLDNKDVQAMAVDPNDPTGRKLWAGDNDDWGATPAYVRRSDDGGATWFQNVPLPVPYGVRITSLVAASSSVLLAGTDSGVYRSENGGQTWAESNTGFCPKRIQALSLDPRNLAFVYAAEYRTMYWSTDGGLNWQQKVKGMDLTPVSWISPALPDVVYCIGGETVHKSTDQGQDWEVVDDRLFSLSVSTSPKTPERAYTNLNGPMLDQFTVSRTLDWGAHWENTHYFEDILNQSLALDTVSPNIVYLGIRGPTPPPRQQGCVYKSVDYGAPPWVQLSNSPYHVISLSTDSRGWVYAGTSDWFSGVGSVCRSIDGGANWTGSPLGLPQPCAPMDIHANPLVPDRVYTRLDGGVYKSNDGCQSWAPAGLQGLNVLSLAMDPAEPEILYAAKRDGSDPGRTFVTVDGGREWTVVGSLLPTDAEDLAMDGSLPTSVYAGTGQTAQRNYGVYSLTPAWQFKALTSASDNASDYNSQRKLVREEWTGNLHAVYHSGGSAGHNIYYTASTDGGNSWSPKVLLGQGKHPAVALDQFGNPLVVYLSDDEHTIFYAGRIWGTWTAPYALYTQGPQYKFGPPSLVTEPLPIEEDRGHIVFHCEGPEPDASWSILYGAFYPFNPSPLQTEVVDASPDWPCVRPSLARHPGTNTLHAVWCKEDQYQINHVFYSSKLIGGNPWELPYRIDIGDFPNYDPSIEVYGDRVHAVWVNQEACHKIFYRYREVYLPVWSSMEIVSGNECVERASPQMAAGSYCVWKEGNEIFYNWRSPWEGWQTPVNWSNTPQLSTSPQVTFAPWMMGTTLYCFWTEDDAAPYQEYFATTMGPLGGFFTLDAGQEQASPYTVHRGGYQQYAQNVEKTVDMDGSYLSYRFRHLDPRKLYLVRASYYQETGSSTGLEVKVDGAIFANVAVPNRAVIRGEAWVPSEVYADSVVEFVIRKKSGTLGSLGYLELCQAEPKGKGGPQSSELADLYLPKEFSLGAGYPNPLTSEARIEYALPKASGVDLTVFNVSGQVVKRLVSESSKAPGRYSVRWDGKNDQGHKVPGGVYFYRLKAGSFFQTKKLVVVR